MQKITLSAWLLALGGTLAACATPPAQRTTFDKINASLKEGAAGTLAHAPRQPDAVADALLPPVATINQRLPRGRAAQEERFNVAFNGVPVQQFYQSIVEGTRYNMLVHPDVSGTISANLKDVTMVEALDAIREMYGFDYKIDGTRISIKPLTMQTRVFQINYLIGSRKGSSNLKVTSTSVSSAQSNQNNNQNNNNQTGNGQNNNNGNNNGSAASSNGPQESSNVATSTSSEFWTELKAALDAIVVPGTAGRSVVISPQSGVIVVRGMPDDLRNVADYLKASQLSVNRQVILEAKILEVELNDSFQMGINWAGFGNYSNGTRRLSSGFLQPGTTLTPTGGTMTNTGQAAINAVAGSAIGAVDSAAGSLFGLAFQTQNFATLIAFLESQGTVHVLSSPRIATMNNQKAVLKIGTDEFYVTGVTQTTNTNLTGNSTSTPSVQLQPFFSGVVLDVTPQIDDRGNIILHVHPSVSQVSTVTKGINLGTAGSLSLPLAASSTSEMDSMVRGQDGRVVAIGGLMRQSSTSDESGVPGARKVPVLGALFANKGRVNQKRELVVLIKPTIVDENSPHAFGNDMLDASKRIEAFDERSK